MKKICIILLMIGSFCVLFSCKERGNASDQLAKQVLGDMVKIPGGTFTMGTDNIKYADFYGSNQHPHKVTLSSFYIDSFMLTGSQLISFYKLIGISGGEFLKNTELFGGARAGIVTYKVADKFCIWMSKKTDLPFDLPTEAQWMYAASDQGKLKVSTNSGFVELGKNFPGSQVDFVPSINQYPPNPLGVYMMSGAEKQWTQDWYSDSYYWVSPKKDPKGPKSGLSKVLVGSDFRMEKGKSTTEITNNNNIYLRVPGPVQEGARAAVRCVINTSGPIYPNKLMQASV
ncbi:Serine/threonine-protein kinase pkn1 [Piscirickettsia salmonis]|uniref:Formylglycine-generating sulfatase enzyme family protein n=1 Tax=Piscirickettsia salmonis TaxID=1238 RepID=A0A1L6TD58_PISSA|nr:SUMF1/EgtB/PvdO family nonheme iron enzyme [Piscirickettsia salmonis]AKP74367.1 hypothetical protein PSLF89_2793 [Piscirickettsia salmonis LF-89 = ATCC VR-1361]ALB23317.1 formylglycine-generating sulfatase enzyme family protein [Piscirickettsia salmonis]ALY03216.1 hypothetical protein AWE47_10480 [Piscirickettsia salmonis]AMA42781.1 hypothetical protein AWJ11_10700 [Piscirickettsia salmonis]AOS35251.1 hypothetical protein AVM72_07835 [Piscirickettsia salmonis]